MYIHVYVGTSYVYTMEEADVPKPSRVHMGHVRPKLNDVVVVYKRLNV